MLDLFCGRFTKAQVRLELRFPCPSACDRLDIESRSCAVGDVLGCRLLFRRYVCIEGGGRFLRPELLRTIGKLAANVDSAATNDLVADHEIQCELHKRSDIVRSFEDYFGRSFFSVATQLSSRSRASSSDDLSLAIEYRSVCRRFGNFYRSLARLVSLFVCGKTLGMHMNLNNAACQGGWLENCRRIVGTIGHA